MTELSCCEASWVACVACWVDCEVSPDASVTIASPASISAFILRWNLAVGLSLFEECKTLRAYVAIGRVEVIPESQIEGPFFKRP